MRYDPIGVFIQPGTESMHFEVLVHLLGVGGSAIANLRSWRGKSAIWVSVATNNEGSGHGQNGELSSCPDLTHGSGATTKTCKNGRNHECSQVHV